MGTVKKGQEVQMYSAVRLRDKLRGKKDTTYG